jgi:hypothetical protein
MFPAGSGTFTDFIVYPSQLRASCEVRDDIRREEFVSLDGIAIDKRPSAMSISTRRRVSSLRLIVITVIPRHLDQGA